MDIKIPLETLLRLGEVKQILRLLDSGEIQIIQEAPTQEGEYKPIARKTRYICHICGKPAYRPKWKTVCIDHTPAKQRHSKLIKCTVGDWVRTK